MDISFFYGFLTGGLTVAIVGSFFRKFSDNQRHLEQAKNNKMDLEQLFDDYPQIMHAIKRDINDPNLKSIREFFVVDKDAILNSSIPRLRYELSDESLAVLKRLENIGYIEQLENNCLHYRITEELVVQLNDLS